MVVTAHGSRFPELAGHRSYPLRDDGTAAQRLERDQAEELPGVSARAVVDVEVDNLPAEHRTIERPGEQADH